MEIDRKLILNAFITVQFFFPLPTPLPLPLMLFVFIQSSPQRKQQKYMIWNNNQPYGQYSVAGKAKEIFQCEIYVLFYDLAVVKE